MSEFNSLNPIDIAASGMIAQAKNMEIVSSNVANARTTDAGDGKPYRALEAEFSAINDEGIGGVEVGDIISNMSDFHKILAKPGDPRSDAEGYISLPNVSLPQELISLNYASRNYQANVAVLKRYQTMVNTTLELLK